MIEVLISLTGIIMITFLVSQILIIVSKTSIPSVTQFDVFKVQLRQLLIRNYYQCTPDTLHLSEFTIREDRGRLIKEPGYEILYEPLSNIQFNCSADTLYFKALIQGNELDFEIKTK